MEMGVCTYSLKEIDMPKKGYKPTEEHKKNNSLAKSGKNHPNYGKRLPESTRLKIGESNKLVWVSKDKRIEASYKNSGCNNPWYGKKHTKESIEKIRQAGLGRKHTPKVIAKMKGKVGKWMKGRKLSESTKEKLREYMINGKQAKENNYNWKGGLTYNPYPVEFSEQLKRTISYRDSHTCNLCLGYFPNRGLCIHHIDYDKSNNTVQNLMALCRSCHTKTNGNREYWKTILPEVMKCNLLNR